MIASIFRSLNAWCNIEIYQGNVIQPDPSDIYQEKIRTRKMERKSRRKEGKEQDRKKARAAPGLPDKSMPLAELTEPRT